LFPDEPRDNAKEGDGRKKQKGEGEEEPKKMRITRESEG
jgi:hypothetical protein